MSFSFGSFFFSVFCGFLVFFFVERKNTAQESCLFVSEIVLGLSGTCFYVKKFTLASEAPETLYLFIWPHPRSFYLPHPVTKSTINCMTIHYCSLHCESFPDFSQHTSLSKQNLQKDHFGNIMNTCICKSGMYITCQHQHSHDDKYGVDVS